MELRDIEIFLTLAEELHFTRTADRLHVSPARVSQAIRKQEREVGARLFERTSRSVRLTPIGERLYADLRPAYREMREGMRRARLAARGETAVLRVGMLPGNAHDLRPYWEAFRDRHPDWGLRIRHNPFIDPFGPLRNGDVDVLVSWLPVEEPDLTVGPVVFTESRVLLATPDHPLAARTSASVEDLGDFGVLGPAAPLPDYWEDAFLPFETPSGRPIERGPVARQMDDILTTVSTGEVVHHLGAHAARYYNRPDVAFLPLRDAPRLRWGLVWRSDARCERIRALAGVVRDLGTADL
ncbi:LysR family transcriptional regulator [Actinomadura kijaniata]|uniref:LysR substrate-binding domain-containing protein n=1 Tax=Actinomadura kijaniata TaxID=46161 RepID=UPI000832F98F|nr:LysR family transcriptional regulator [Actinomadura kijaniata]